MGEYALLYILFAPFAGALALILVSNRQPLLVRGIAVTAAGVSLLASLYLFYSYDPVRGGFQFIQRFEWSRQLGISLHLGVDGIGTPLVLASSILLFRRHLRLLAHQRPDKRVLYLAFDPGRRHDRRLHVAGSLLPVFLL